MCVGFDTGAGKVLLVGAFPAWDVSARRAVRPFHLNLYGSGERAFRNGSEGLLLCAYPERRGGGCAGGILARTELSVCRAYHSLPGCCLDAMDVLAQACITACGYKLRMV